MRSVLLGAVMSLVAIATPARAVTYMGSLPGAPDPGASGNLVIDFDHPLPAGIVFTPGSTYSILTGLVPHRGYNPAGDLTAYLAVPGTGTSGAATLDFSGFTGGVITDFSFYWGSIDRANQLTITTNLGSYTLLGSDVVSSGYGSATSARDNRRVFFALDHDERLQSIHIASPTAFELDDIIFHVRPQTPVPEPASWVMLVAGFGLIGGALRRHRAASACTAASPI